MTTNADQADGAVIQTLTISEARARLFNVLDELHGREEIHITKHGGVIARILPHGSRRLFGLYEGLVVQNCTDDELINFKTWPDEDESTIEP